VAIAEAGRKTRLLNCIIRLSCELPICSQNNDSNHCPEP
jgi:hypothetical protein